MILSYLKNLSNLLFSKKTKLITNNVEDEFKKINKEKYVCEINFKVTENQDIDIEFVHKDVQKSSVDDISVLGEICANLIVLINNGLVKKQLLNTIKHHKKQNMDNDKNTLLLDNILFFNNLLQDELKAIKKEIGPLIRPSSVFRSLD